MAAFVPRPTELLPARPDAVVDLQTAEGAALVGGHWHYADAEITEVDFVAVGSDLGPSGPPNRTHELLPRGGGLDVDESSWSELTPEQTQRRLGSGRVSFVWYRIAVTLPERIGDTDVRGSTVMFECVVDDSAEIWVDGELPLALGLTGGQVAAGFNAPNRVVLTRDARPGQRFQLAVLGINGPISVGPANYVWVRSATLDLYAAPRAVLTEPVRARVERLDDRLDAVLPPTVAVERVATGFEFTEGPVWADDGVLLFSSPNANVIYRWSPLGAVSVWRTKSGYAGVDIGRYAQPGSNGLAFDPQGRLAICQHGNRRVIRVEPRGNTTVLADSFQGRRLNSPNDLAYSSTGVLYFTDPPFGLPSGFDDPKKELPFSGVFAVRDGVVELVSDDLRGPNGIALSPDERWLYVGNWDPARKVVVRFRLDAEGRAGVGEVVADLTDAPGDDAIDGLAVDARGHLYVCGPGGIWVLGAEGERLGLLELPEAPHNLTWGGQSRSDLYITAMTSIYRTRPLLGGPIASPKESRR